MDLALDDPEFVQKPYRFFRDLREHSPLYRLPSGAWLLTRYEDVLAALTDQRLGNAPSPYAVVNERNKGRYVCADVATRILPFLDPPRHPAERRVIGGLFRDHLRKSPPDLEGVALEVLRRQPDRFDLIADVGTPFTVRVLSRILGVPDEDNEHLTRWSEMFFYLFMQIPSEQVRRDLDQALTEFREYFRTVIEERRASPQDDFISLALAHPELSEATLVDTAMLLFADGVENVDKLLGSAFFTVEQQAAWPEQDDTESWAALIEECLRYESPAQLVGRVAKDDFEYQGAKIRRGTSVLLGLGSANRDPQAFPEADSFIPNRTPNAHLTFGKGAHSCVGAKLVKLELSALLRVIRRERPELKMRQEALTWRARMGHRWPESCLVSG